MLAENGASPPDAKCLVYILRTKRMFESPLSNGLLNSWDN